MRRLGWAAGIAVLIGIVTDLFVVEAEALDYDLFGLSLALPTWLAVSIAIFVGMALIMAWYDRRLGRLDAAEVGIIMDPSDEREYNQMYDGFRHCEFLAFNPPFKIEGGPDDAGFQAAAATHAQRYARGVKARYLFFDEACLARARRFFDRLEAEGVPVRSHVQVALSDEGPHALTFFTGRRPTGFLKQVPESVGRSFDTPTVVMYPEELNQDGYPEAVVVIEGAKSLHDILRRRFHKAWSKARVMPWDAPSPAEVPQGVVVDG